MIICSSLTMKSIYMPVFCYIILNILLYHHCVQGQVNQVSSKLDFDDNADNPNANNNNTNVQGLSGGGQVGNDGQGTGRRNIGDGTNTAGSGSGGSGTGSSGSGGSAGGKGPKIHGVRVTVDTGDGQKSKESKESVEITDLGKHKKRVGIHTDITFEITTDGDANETSSAQRGDKEDASVPIFKGRGSGSDSKHKSRKPYDPKSQWNPNFSTERRGYGGGYDEFYGGGGGGGSRTGGGGAYYPHSQYYPQQSVPVYTSGGGGGGGIGDTGTIYRSGEGWTHYVPVWTTERSPSEQSQVYRRPSWKPCYCMSSYGTDYRRRRASLHGSKEPKTLLKPTSAVIQIVDGKLERPFS